MANAQVSSAAIGKAIQMCNGAVTALNDASKQLQTRYQAAGSGWKDSKYAQLGGIVSNCQNALGEPVSKIQDCIETLQEIASIVASYEEVNL